MKVFSFNSAEDKNEPSSVILVRGPSQLLPERFAICFSMKQDKVDERSPLVIRDEDDQPWIALSIWLRGGQIGLWMQVGKSD